MGLEEKSVEKQTNVLLVMVFSGNVQTLYKYQSYHLILELVHIYIA